jgi:hypothetical protein
MTVVPREAILFDLLLNPGLMTADSGLVQWTDPVPASYTVYI